MNSREAAVNVTVELFPIIIRACQTTCAMRAAVGRGSCRFEHEQENPAREGDT